MNFFKNITVGVALLALSTFCIITPYAHNDLKKNDANEQAMSFVGRLVDANIHLIKGKFFDEYQDAIVFNIGKARNNKAFLKSLLSNIMSEFPDRDRQMLASLLVSAIEANLTRGMQSLVKYNPVVILNLMD